MTTGTTSRFAKPFFLSDVSPCDTLYVRKTDFSLIASRHAEAYELWQWSEKRHSGKTTDRLITETSFFEKLRKSGNDARPRFTNAERVGSSSERMFFADDENCHRKVAVRFLGAESSSGSVSRFFREAEILSQLEHPGIVPIYDFDADSDGHVYMCLRRVSGFTLRDYIDGKDVRDLGDPIESTNDLVSVLIRAAETLVYAHENGIIHQTMKPENILIDRFGQVFVLDWSGPACDEDELALAPCYMSPQQIQPATPMVTDDVFALGAILFHCLTKRVPTQYDCVENLMRRRQNGEIDAPTVDEMRESPVPLLAIAQKAMARKRQNRYHTMAELLEDLRKYQAGEPLAAYRESLLGVSRRWVMGHRYLALAGVIICMLLFGTGWYLYESHLHRMAYWGMPVFTENFERDSWREEWLPSNQSFRTDDGYLETTGENLFLLYRRRLYGSTAFEFTGTAPENGKTGDLSVVWAQEPELNGRSVEKPGEQLLFQTGGFNNSFSGIVYRKEGWSQLDYSGFRHEPGESYTIRAEVDGEELRLYVNGEKHCHTKVNVPLTSGYIGFYLFGEGRRVDDVRIYSKGLRSTARATDLGDAFFRKGLWRDAAEEYAIVADSYGEERLGLEASLKEGLCYDKLQEHEKATECFRRLVGTELEHRTHGYFLMRLFESGDQARMLYEFERLWQEGDAAGRKQLVVQWALMVGKIIMEKSEKERVRTLVEVKERYFPEERSQNFLYGYALNRIGRYEDVLEKCPKQDAVCASALTSLGRYEDVVQRYPHIHWIATNALVNLGDYERLKRMYPKRKYSQLQALEVTHQYNRMLLDFADNKKACAIALLALGRAEEMLDKSPESHGYAKALIAAGRGQDVLGDNRYKEKWLSALLHLGRYEEILERFPDSSTAHTALVRMGRAEEALERSTIVFDRADALAALGKVDEALALLQTPCYLRNRLLILAGRQDEVTFVPAKSASDTTAIILAQKGEFDELDKRFGDLLWVRAHQVLRSMEKDQLNFELFEQVLWATMSSASNDYLHHVIIPFLYVNQDKNDRFETHIRTRSRFLQNTLGGRLYSVAAYILGELDDKQFQERTNKRFLEGDLALAKAMRAEYRGDADAFDLYMRYRKLPAHKRELNPVVDYFVEWRCHQAKGGKREQQ